MHLEQPPSNELVHSGVKGMKWGVTRSTTQSHADYSKGRQAADARVLGARGVKRINNRMHKGETHGVARKKVIRNHVARRLAVTGALILAPHIIELGTLSSGSIAQRAQTKRGEASVAAAMGLPRKASSGPNYAKKRGGSYNISSV